MFKTLSFYSLLLVTANAVYYDFASVGTDILVPLDAMMNNYRNGKLTNEDFSLYVDDALAKEPNPKAKAEILQHAVDGITFFVRPRRPLHALAKPE
jgi:hypothetical protein